MNKFKLFESVLVKSTPKSSITNKYRLPSFIGKIVTIDICWYGPNGKYYYFVKEDCNKYIWSEDMFASINNKFVDLNTI